ncbi:MAG TPA: hypothetical protein VHC86_11740 [Opitutaceae bacterium]|nr:hypothetical protein [Opitutaceae bacterium]
MPRLTRFFRLLLLLVPAAVAARADEPPIIAKARAFLGSEEALSAVKSVHLQGTFLAGDPQQAAKATPSSVDIIFQKPYQQHMIVSSKEGVRTLALDGYDGWERLQFPATNPNPTLRLLIPDQIRVLRADVWENLGYYRGLEAEGGQVKDEGPATIDGVACEKIAFIHGWALDGTPNPAYYRYFDQATGRLVHTETSGGLEIREEGEQTVSGIRFPRRIVSSRKANGASSTETTLTLDKVTINEVFPASLFAVPLPSTEPAPPSEGVPAAAASAAPAAPAPAASPAAAR